MNSAKRKQEEETETSKKTRWNPNLPLGGAKGNWSRPPTRQIDPKLEDFVFQQMESDYTTGEPVEGMPGSMKGPVPIIRFFGVTEEGNSVFCKIHGFTPYFYIPAPPEFKENDVDLFKIALNKRIEDSIRQWGVKEGVVAVETCRKESLMNYAAGGATRLFLKISVAIPKLVPVSRTAVESGLTVPGYGQRSYQPYEADLPFVLRYMCQQGIGGAQWVKLPAGAYRWTPPAQRGSHCQWECDVAWTAVTPCPSDVPQWSRVAPLRILSFDIECAGRKGVFPEPDKDPVIQIANLVTVQGESKPFIRNVFTLGSCTQIIGAQVLDFKDERKLLQEWHEFIMKVDPDVIIGYNTSNFDFPYLVNRAKALKLDSFLYLGRLKNSKVRIKDSTFSSRAYGKRETKETTLEGRVQLDLLQAIQRDHKLRSYTLNAVSAHFLGEQKEDVNHSIITDLFNGTDDDRRRLAVYCLKDAYLPQRLLDKLMIMYNYVEMARVTGVPLSYLLARGQQIKVVSQLYRKANEENLIIPCYRKQGSQESTYEGATVIEPKRGFYSNPIATLDFSSLYPSIMMAHNLCYSTLVRRQDMGSLKPEDYEITPTNDCFVRSHVKKGILPRILEELLGARARAKAELKEATDPSLRAVLDGRQLALKISANSVYGFTGATVGKLPCLPISASVTGYGREMIELTKKLVEEHYTQANGFPQSAVVVYGDTDSVMVDFRVDTVEAAMKYGTEAAAMVSTHFTKPIKLEFEKVYSPYLLITRKRYAGLLWTNPNKYDKLDAKGIETVRRDNCPLVKNVISTCLDKILINRDIEGAKEYTKSVISDLLQNKLDLSLLVITKALSKEGTEYATKQAHVELAQRMKKRNAHSAPAIGDRVPYVMIKAAKGAKGYEKAEDPLWVLENNIPLDYQYYLENQLKNPLMRIFAPLMEDPQTLLVGEHTRRISMPTPKVGGIIGFAVKKLSCIGCKAPLTDGEYTTCSQCRHKEPELYQTQLSTVRSLESQFSRAWTQCQVCQGSLHQTVLCTSRDCPIFYMRKKVQKDLGDAQEMLQRFDLSW